jgi:hypothetical protein
MDDWGLMTLGIVIGVALLIFGSRIRSRSHRRPRSDEAAPRDPSE